MLGPVSAVRDDAPVKLAGRLQRAVLVRLVIAAGATVSIERIADDLWHGEPPPAATGVIQAHISTLRRALEPSRAAGAAPSVIVSRQPGYAVLVSTDAERFAALLDEAVRKLDARDNARGAALLDEALGLWQGTPFADLADEPWLGAEISRLEDLQLVATEQRLRASVELGELHSALPRLDQLTREYPLRELPWRLLALALYRADRQAEALESLRRARAALVDGVGIDPGRSLVDLEAAILSQSDELHLRATTPAPARSALALLGREDLRSHVLATAEECATGGFRAAVVSGEPGIGKTHLLDVVAADLTTSGWSVVWGRCHEASGAPALWPWLQILESLSSVSPLPPDLADLASGTAAEEVDAGESRFAQRQSIGRYLASVADSSPVAIIVDDIQWADAASLALAAEMPELLRDDPVLLIVATRSHEPSAEADRALLALSRAGALRLPLGGLSSDAVAEFAGAAGVEVDVDELVRRTGGNPFLLRETLRAVATDGSPALESVPEGAAALLRQRLAALPAGVVAVLQIAAVCGSGVDPALVAAGQDSHETAVAEALDAATVAGILDASRDGALRFSHDLVRETLYDDIPPQRRAQMHGRIVAALESRTETDVTMLATHSLAAGPRAAESAVRWSIASAELALARLAFDDAIRWWRAALRSHESRADSDPAERVELLLRLIHAQLDATDSAGAEQSRIEAVLAADRTDDPLLRARALTALDLPNFWIFRAYDDIDLDLIGRIERTLERELPLALRARLLTTLSQELSYENGPRRLQVADEAVAIARSIDDPKVLGLALNAQVLALNRGGGAYGDRVRDIAEELVALGTRSSNSDLALVGHLALMLHLLSGYDIEASGRHTAEVGRMVARSRRPVSVLQYRMWQRTLATVSGRFDEADELIATISDRAFGLFGTGPIMATVRLLLLMQQDRLAEAEELLPSIAGLHPAIAHDARVLVLAAIGDTEAAERLAAIVPRPPIPSDWVAPPALVVRGLSVAAFGTERLRRETYDALLPQSGVLIVGGTFDAGPGDYYLGILARSLGEDDAAERHFAIAEARSQGAGLTWWVDEIRRMRAQR